MTSGDDLQAIEEDFARFLGSIRIKLAGDAASEAREASEEEKTALLEQLMRKIDEAASVNREREKELEKAASAARAREPVADVEVRFDKAVATAGLEDKRDVLRQIVLSTVSLTEIDVAEAYKTWLSSIGGGPDLPEGMDWPRDASGLYLNFWLRSISPTCRSVPKPCLRQDCSPFSPARITAIGVSNTRRPPPRCLPMPCRTVHWTPRNLHLEWWSGIQTGNNSWRTGAEWTDFRPRPTKKDA